MATVCALRAQAFLARVRSSFDRISHRVSVSHHGSYSVERMYALESYCNRTSRLRVMGVCFVFFLSVLLLSILQEMIPLQNPSDGWRANYGCWVRLWLMCTANTLGVIIQIDALVPELNLGAWSIICACVSNGSIYTLVMIGLASLWVFPTPFGIMLGSIPWPLVTAAVLLVTVGIKRLRSHPNLRHQILHQLYLIGVQATLVIVYSAYGAAYSRAPEEHKVLVMTVLPVIKLVMQNVVSWAMRDLEEHQPGIIVFCVGFFNAVYMSKCMQSSGSRVTYGFVLVFDLLQSYLGLRRLETTVGRLRELAQKWDPSCEIDGNLLQAVVRLSKEPGVVWHKDDQPPIRIQAPVKILLAHEHAAFLKHLASTQLQQIGAAHPSGANALAHTGHGSMKIIPDQPESSSGPEAILEKIKLDRISSVNHMVSKHEIVRLALKLLFENEFHVLVEYVESVVPMMYAVYLAVVCHLSGAEYYPETRGKSVAQVESMVLNIAVYAMLEAFSFVLAHYCVKWKSTLSLAQLLAFVIENQTQELSGRLFVWYFFLLQFPLVHFGVDFTMRFAWLKHEP